MTEELYSSVFLINTYTHHKGEDVDKYVLLPYIILRII